MTKPALFLLALIFAACGGSSDKPAAGAGQNTSAPPKAEGDYYFSYTVDGKTFNIPTDSVLVSYRDTDSSLRFFVSDASQQAAIVLTVPHIAKCPCSVPSGSEDLSLDIKQGSISLQNYKGENITWNSYNDAETPIEPSAINITKVDRPSAEYRIVEGIFAANVYGPQENGKWSKASITGGKFRVKAEKTHGSIFE